MSNDNTRDAAEPSLASAGSHVELHRAVRALLDGVNARYAKNPREWTCPHMQALDDMTQSEPQPTLTDDEREAFKLASKWCRAHGGAVYDAGHAIERFLERRVVAERNADIERLTAEVERLRLTASEREAIEAAIFGDVDPSVIALLRNLLARLGGGE